MLWSLLIIRYHSKWWSCLFFHTWVSVHLRLMCWAINSLCLFFFSLILLVIFFPYVISYFSLLPVTKEKRVEIFKFYLELTTGKKALIIIECVFWPHLVLDTLFTKFVLIYKTVLKGQSLLSSVLELLLCVATALLLKLSYRKRTNEFCPSGSL